MLSLVPGRIGPLFTRSIYQVKNYSINFASSFRCINSIFRENSYLYRHNSTMSEASSQDQTTSEGGHNLDKVYVQYQPNDEMTISFRYCYQGKSKAFNLKRAADETLNSSFERIKLNLAKIGKRPKKFRSCQIEEEEQVPSADIGISLNGLTMDPNNSKNSDAWVEGAVLDLNGTVYQVTTNTPMVLTMKLPCCIMEGFTILPLVALANCDLKNCIFSWYRKISSKERKSMVETNADIKDLIHLDRITYWYKLADTITYCPVAEDLDHYLKLECIPFDGEKQGPKHLFVSANPVKKGPTCCPFEKRHSLTPGPITDPDRFRMVSYNILADLYADSKYSRSVLFAHCPTHALELDYRRQLLIKEISGYNADIICLQEVDQKEFLRTYQPLFELVSTSHSGVFNPKGGNVAEGQATFFRRNRFSLIETHRTILSKLIEPTFKSSETSTDPVGVATSEDSVKGGGDDQSQDYQCDEKTHPILEVDNPARARECLSRFDDIRAAINSNSNLRERFVNRHSSLQTLLLKVVDRPNKFLIVANTHLYFAPDADHIRLLQGSVCIKYLEYLKIFYSDMIKSVFEITEPDLSIIFCGDMNSSPDCGLYKLVREGAVSDDLADWTSNKDEAVVGLSIETGLRFSSAYENIEYTNYTPQFHGCLDYIYFERDGLDCESIVPLPDHEDVIATNGIPNEVFPSDHLALVANLKLSR